MQHPLKSLQASRPAATESKPPGGDGVAEAKAGPAAAGGGRRSQPVETEVGVRVSPGMSILAIQAAPSPDGTPGAVEYGDNLTMAERRFILQTFQWCDSLDRRVRKLNAKAEETAIEEDDYAG